VAQEVAVAPQTWAYVYARPADCLRALYMVVAGAPPNRYDGMPEIQFETSGDYTGLGANVDVIYTDQKPAFLRYTARRTDPDEWPSEFQTCLGWALAAAAALNLTASASTAQTCARTYLSMFATATQANAREGTTRASEQTAPWDKARG